LAIPCCPLSISLPSITPNVKIPGINKFIAAINAALTAAFAQLPVIKIPKCKL
jgi:hypothetical protein